MDTIVEGVPERLPPTPGTPIATGTPEAGLHRRQPLEFVKGGDVVEAEVEGLRRPRHPIIGR